MHQAKKGNQWYFGLKAHIGVDKESGLVHTLVTTAANVRDISQTPALLHGQEEEVWLDAGWGCKPKPPIFPSAQIEPRHDRIKVDGLPNAAERVMPVQMDVTPRCRRDRFDHGKGFRIAVRLVSDEQPRQDGGVVKNDGIGD